MQCCFENEVEQFVSGKPVFPLEADHEATGLGTGVTVESRAALPELRYMCSLLLVQPQEPSQALQIHC